MIIVLYLIILLFSFIFASDTSTFCESTNVLVDGGAFKKKLKFTSVVDLKKSKFQDDSFHKELKQTFLNTLYNKIDEYNLCYLDYIDYGESLNNKLIQYIKTKRISSIELKKKMNTLDFLLYVKISNSNKVNKDFIEIKLFNSDVNKIKVSGVLAKHKVKGLDFLAQKSDIEQIFNLLIIDFLNKYFLSSVEILNIDLDEDFKIIVNGEEKESYKKSQNYVVVYDIPRNIKSYVQVESKSYISKKNYIDPSPLYLLKSNRSYNINEKVENCLCDNSDMDSRCRIVCQKEKLNFEIRDKYPIAKLDLSNFKGKRIEGLLSPEIKIFNFKHKEKINYTFKDELYFLNSKYEGKYLATMKLDEYASPFPFIIEFDDSSNYKRNIKTYKKIDLYKTSKPIAHSLNVLFPGAGLFYAKDKNWMSSVHLSSYFAMISMAYISYDNFLKNRDNYYIAISEYDNESTLENKNNVKYKFSLAEKSKNEFRTYLGISLIINVLSNYYLDKFFRGKLKWF